MVGRVSLAEELQALRQARSLSVSETSALASVSRATLSNWEAGTHLPRGAALERLLSALEADERTRTRLLQACDPVYARLALAPTRLGPPIGPGHVIRGMRVRRGSTQADLARSVAVTQATVARWESGDLVPSAETLHAVGYVLGASADEVVALAQTQGSTTDLTPWLEGEFDQTLGFPEGHPLTEIVALGLEAELWRRAVQDPQWEAHLCCVIGARVTRLFLEGRYEEAKEPARRAIRLASTPETRIAATYSVGILAAIDRRQNGPADRAAKVLGTWLERLPDSPQKAWMIASRAWRLATLSRAEEAAEGTERAADMDARFAPFGTEYSEFLIRAWRCEMELAAKRPDRAADSLDGRYVACGGTHTALSIRVGHALGKTASEEAMEAIRPQWRDGIAPMWMERQVFSGIEREQRRMLAASR